MRKLDGSGSVKMNTDLNRVTVRIIFFSGLLAGTAAVLPGAWAADYYVANNGDDSNPGTSPAQPWKTVHRVNQNVFQAGDSLRFKAGDFFNGPVLFTPTNARGSPNNPITITSYGNGRATIGGSGVNGIDCRSVAAIRIINLNFEGRDWNPAVPTIGIHFNNEMNTTLSHVRVDNVQATGFAAGIFFTQGPGILHSYTDVDISYVRVDGGDFGIVFFNDINAVPEDALFFSNVKIRHCVVTNVFGGDRPVNPRAAMPIFIGGVHNGLIEHCSVSNPGVPPFPPIGTYGIWAYAVRDVVIQFNEVSGQRNSPIHYADAGGINLRGSNSVVQYNYAHNNDGIGYLFDDENGPPVYRGVIVRYNISWENNLSTFDPGSIEIWGHLEDSEFYNNIIYTPRSTTGSPAIHIVADYGELCRGCAIRNVRFRNNIVITDNGLPQIRVVDPQNMSGLVFQNNSYFDSGAGYKIEWGSNTYTDIAAWASAQSQERFGTQFVFHAGNPRLCSLGPAPIMYPNALSNLKAPLLRADSPLIGRGRDLLTESGVNMGPHDFFGNPLPPSPGPYDIGPHQRAAAQTCAPVPRLSNIRATALSPTSATIEWRTDVSAGSAVDYGPTAAYGQTASGTPGLSHAVSLTNLAPDTVYYYRVRSDEAVSGPYFAFKTLATSPSVPEGARDEVDIQPNPLRFDQGQTRFVFSNLGRDGAQIDIFTREGVQVAGYSTGEDSAGINAGDWPSGMYIALIRRSGKDSVVRKVAVIR